jgi:hypothetical protein
MRALSMRPGVFSLSAPTSAPSISAARSAGTNSRPGFVQNCPTPIVADPANPLTISSCRRSTAPGVTKVGLSDPISP